MGQDVQKLKRREEVVMVGDYNSRVGKANRRGQVIGQYGQDEVSANGKVMLGFLGTNELMAINSRSECDRPEYTRQRLACGEFSILDYILMDRGTKQAPQLHVSKVDVGSTDDFLIWADTNRRRKVKNMKERRVFRWRVERLGNEAVLAELQKRMAANVEQFRGLLRTVDEEEGGPQEAGDRAERVVRKKVVWCGVLVKWWDEESKKEIGERREIFKQHLKDKTEGSWELYRAKRKHSRAL